MKKFFNQVLDYILITMSGIVFNYTKNLKKIRKFYEEELDIEIWLDQGGCVIFKDDNLLLGFCERDKISKDNTITFFYDTKESVNDKYEQLKNIAVSKPEENDEYSIYHFYAKDPENRDIEFQTFLNPTKSYRDARTLLETRRSVRNFKSDKVTKDVFWRIFENCRFSPTSKNSESYKFKVIKNSDILEKLSQIRDWKSAPISNAPSAVAIYTDPKKTKRVKEDGCIAAYHFMLSAWDQGLGTCWIADMDRKKVKELISIPLDHHIATITPLGYPKNIPDTPNRRKSEEMVEFLENK